MHSQKYIRNKKIEKVWKTYFCGNGKHTFNKTSNFNKTASASEDFVLQTSYCAAPRNP